MLQNPKSWVWVAVGAVALWGCGDSDAATNPSTMGGAGGATAGALAAGASGTQSPAAGTGVAGRAAGAGTGTAGMATAGSGTAGTSTGGMAAAGTGGMAAGTGGTAAGAGGMMAAGAGGGMAGGGAAGMTAGGMLTLQLADVAMSGGMLPAEYRCMGSAFGPTGPSPEMTWTAGPAGTMAYAVTLTDLSNSFEHWTIYDIPASVMMLPKGVPAGAMPAMPAGAKQTRNRAPLAGPGYFGPCAGLTTYQFKIYAIDVATLPMASESAPATRMALDMHSLATATFDIMSARP